MSKQTGPLLLLSDDYTPREFVTVFKAVFRMMAEQAYRVMITAHKRAACVVAVFTKGRRRDQSD